MSDFARHERNNPTGSLWPASAHIITAVIGSGALGLSWAVARLGWIAGPFLILFFLGVTLYTSTLLAECYRSSENGNRNYTYMDAVRDSLGGFQAKVCGAFLYLDLIGMPIRYTAIASASMTFSERSNCFPTREQDTPCIVSRKPYMITFAVVQMILCQIPELHQIWWLSLAAAVMSLIYPSIAVGLGIAKVAENGDIKGSLTGISSVTNIQKLSAVSEAIGLIAFAYSFSLILIEIQDTITGCPPSESKTKTKKAILVSGVVTAVVSVSCACFGYAAFGGSSPANLLTGLSFHSPYWLLDIANAAVVIHLTGAYQVFCRLLFAFVEEKLQEWFSNSEFLRTELAVPIPVLGPYKLSVFRLIWRTIFVMLTTVVSMFVPSFDDIAGMLGAFGFWKMNIYFPVAIYISENKIRKWSGRWIMLQILTYACLMLSIPSKIISLAKLVTCGLKDCNTGRIFCIDRAAAQGNTKWRPWVIL